MLEFPKHQRLLRRPQFTKTMDHGTKVVSPYLVIIARRNSEALSKVGFIVSKKVGNAVIRNQVKRRLREIFRTYRLKPQGLDIVVIARGQSVGVAFTELTGAFVEGLDKLRVRLLRSYPDGSECKTLSPLRGRAQ